MSRMSHSLSQTVSCQIVLVLTLAVLVRVSWLCVVRGAAPYEGRLTGTDTPGSSYYNKPPACNDGDPCTPCAFGESSGSPVRGGGPVAGRDS